MQASEKSAEMCSALEGQALEDERAEELRIQNVARLSWNTAMETGKPVEVELTTTKTDIGDYIDILRIEAGITQERLAELTGINIRNVQKHIAGHATPSRLTCNLYNHAFCKLLNRSIDISNKP
jgi:DNA-binding XRE family transcriptional regulator